MNWTVPGTVLTAKREDAVFIEQQFSSMFLGGGIVLSQVSAITGLEPYTVQNWVKREFLPPPESKRYHMNQLCRVVIINILKNVLPMEKIISLIHYVNDDLQDETDDLIDDARLYFLFVRLAAVAEPCISREELKIMVDQALADYHEPIPGARMRVQKVLDIMLTAWFAASLQKQAEDKLRDL